MISITVISAALGIQNKTIVEKKRVTKVRKSFEERIKKPKRNSLEIFIFYIYGDFLLLQKESQT